MSDDEPMIAWASGQPGARRWERAGAVAVVCARLARRDRIVVHGEPEAAAALLAEVENGFVPCGDEKLLEEIARITPGVEIAGRWLWMDRPGGAGSEPETRTPVAVSPEKVTWLDKAEESDVAALLDGAFPDSYARPGAPGVHRWAGLRDDGGQLVAAAADAWSSPAVGFLGGVVVRPDARGRGLARTVCSFLVGELRRDRIALFADHDNVAAVTTYRKMGFVAKRIAALRRG